MAMNYASNAFVVPTGQEQELERAPMPLLRGRAVNYEGASQAKSSGVPMGAAAIAVAGLAVAGKSRSRKMHLSASGTAEPARASAVVRNAKDHVNLGTVGHVDHGKTTLSAAISLVCA